MYSPRQYSVHIQMSAKNYGLEIEKNERRKKAQSSRFSPYALHILCLLLPFTTITVDIIEREKNGSFFVLQIVIVAGWR